MTLRLRMVAAAVFAVLSVGSHAATPTQAAKTDGKAFGGTLRPRAAAEATTTPTPTRVPGYSAATPPEAAYYTNPSAIAPAAAAATSSSTGYQAVTTSMSSRATFSPVDLDATVARGKTVSADPMTYTSGFAAGGVPGSCVALPPGSGSAGTYEMTCNTGYTPTTETHVCTPSVLIYTATAWHYACNDDGGAPNSCSVIPGGCTHTGDTRGRCLQGSWPRCTEPGEPVHHYDCPSKIPGAIDSGSSTVVTGDTVDDSTCNAWKSNADCTAAADVCIDSSPVTRLAGGIPVTKPCWAWNRTYTCTAIGPPTTDCSSLPRGCVFEREGCITGEDPCMTIDKIYKCPLPPTPGDKTQYICGDDVYCLNGECETIDRTPNTEFKDAAVALNAASEAGKEFDPNTLTLFKGTRNTCGKAIFGAYNCCVPRGFPVLASCSAAEKALAKSQKKGLCTYVGTYCSHKVLGICTEKKEAHCCFLSKISRILQEQGRQQLPKPWDSPKNEKCLGFTIDEFARLDLSRMDFSEVYAEFTDAAQLPNELTTATEMQSKIFDYFAAHH